MSLCYKLETNKHCKSTTIFLKKGLRIECCYFAFTNYFSLFYQYQLEVCMTGRSLCHETVIARGGGKSPLGGFVEWTEEERGQGGSGCGLLPRSSQEMRGVGMSPVTVDNPGLSKQVWKGWLPGGSI